MYDDAFTSKQMQLFAILNGENISLEFRIEHYDSF